MDYSQTEDVGLNGLIPFIIKYITEVKKIYRIAHISVFVENNGRRDAGEVEEQISIDQFLADDVHVLHGYKVKKKAGYQKTLDKTYQYVKHMQFLLRCNLIRFADEMIVCSKDKDQNDIKNELKRQFLTFEAPDDDINNPRYKGKKTPNAKKYGCDDLLISFLAGFYLSNIFPYRQ